MADEGVLTFVIDSDMFILGRLVGSNKLDKPRVFQIVQNPKYDPNQPDMGENSKTLIQLSPLPGTPPFMHCGNITKYPLPLVRLNKSIIDLYSQVTNPAVDNGKMSDG